MTKLDLRRYLQLVKTKGPMILARVGFWNGNGLNKKVIYYEYQVWNKSYLTRYVLNSNRIGQCFTWISKMNS